MTEQSLTPTVPCLLQTWESSVSYLHHWLLKQSGDKDLAADLLQETFLRALTQQSDFCLINDQRAWLFKVANNLLTDELRKNKRSQLNEKDTFHRIYSAVEELRPVDNLVQCLPKALNKLSPIDREIIESCDLQGLKQLDYADLHGISVSAAKSRIQRAREKLRQILKCQCQISFDEHKQVCCFSPQNANNQNKN